MDLKDIILEVFEDITVNLTLFCFLVVVYVLFCWMHMVDYRTFCSVYIRIVFIIDVSVFILLQSRMEWNLTMCVVTWFTQLLSVNLSCQTWCMVECCHWMRKEPFGWSVKFVLMFLVIFLLTYTACHKVSYLLHIYCTYGWL